MNVELSYEPILIDSADDFVLEVREPSRYGGEYVNYPRPGIGNKTPQNRMGSSRLQDAKHWKTAAGARKWLNEGMLGRYFRKATVVRVEMVKLVSRVGETNFAYGYLPTSRRYHVVRDSWGGRFNLVDSFNDLDQALMARSEDADQTSYMQRTETIIIDLVSREVIRVEE